MDLLYLFIYLEISHPEKENPWRWLIFPLLIFPVWGLTKAISTFKSNEKIYLTYYENNAEIVRGVMMLESEKQWVWENMTLRCDAENLLILQYNKFKLTEEYPTEKQLSTCMQILEDEFQRLKRNVAFSTFAEGRKIKFQLFGNEDKIQPIAEKFI